MLFFGEDKKSPNDYIKDSRTPEDFIDFALDELRKVFFFKIKQIFILEKNKFYLNLYNKYFLISWLIKE